ncbi:MAG: murein hydrolase activator EnvC family protein [Actinomycetota bacterium]
MGGRIVWSSAPERWALKTLKVGFISAVAISAVLLGDPTVAAAAATSPAQVSARIEAVKRSLDKLGGQLKIAEREVHAASAAADRHRRALASASARQQFLRAAFSSRAASMYTLGNGSMIETILGASDIDDFVERASYLEQIRSREAGMLEELTALRRRAKTESAELASAVKAASGAQKSLMSRRYSLLASLRELQSLQNLLVSLGGGSRLSRAPNGFRCPVAGPRYVLDNFGDPRPGGPHTGDDIQADYGQGTVAVLPSKVVATPYGSWIGVGIVLRDAIGNEWLYAHLASEYVSVGQRVAAGQLIGRVGCSGRCYGPHLHFEYHPRGGSPANPYRILSAAC